MILTLAFATTVSAETSSIQGAHPSITQPTTQPTQPEEEHVETDPGEFERKAPETRPTTTQATTQPAEAEEEHVPIEPGEFERKPEEEPPPAPPLEKPAPLGFKLGPDLWAYWKDGANLQSVDERFKFKIGGSVMGDIGCIDAGRLERDIGTKLRDHSRWRQNRIYVSGLLYETFEFKLKADFAGGGTRLVDAYLRWRDVPFIGDVTIGHMKEPFGLERVGSKLYVTFVERAIPNAFTPPRGWGVMVNNRALDERMTWGVGLFRDTDDECSGVKDAGNACALTGRITCLPWYEEKGRKLLHLGAAYSLRRPKDPIRYRRRPEVHFVEHLTDTGSFDADRVHLFGAEAALVYGPFSLQGEYIGTSIDSSDSGGLCLNGFYFQASHFLTGEHRRYNTHTGIFGQVLPRKDFLTEGGWGAWEVAARYSYLDLNDSALPVSARRMQNATIGLNWYLNRHMRISWNYVRSCVDGSDTSDPADIFLTRFQVAF